MHARMTGIIAVLVALSLAMPAPLSAQPATPPAVPLFTAPRLDQLLAPVALYPDDLLQQILIASTYPLEVVEAWRWRQSPENAAFAGDALAAALASQDWDPSVKALVPFPGVLQMMNDRLDWMQQLGDAFLAHQGDVMDTIQRLRREARNAGTLVSTPQQVVSDEGQSIVVAPANPAVLYPPIMIRRWPMATGPIPAIRPTNFRRRRIMRSGRRCSSAWASPSSRRSGGRIASTGRGAASISIPTAITASTAPPTSAPIARRRPTTPGSTIPITARASPIATPPRGRA